MKLRRSLYKDLLLRKLYFKYETTLLSLKSLAFNNILPLSIRQSIHAKILQLPIKSTRIRNRCLLTGRGRGILPEFKISRIKFRQLADSGKIPGIRRASW